MGPTVGSRASTRLEELRRRVDARCREAQDIRCINAWGSQPPFRQTAAAIHASPRLNRQTETRRRNTYSNRCS